MRPKRELQSSVLARLYCGVHLAPNHARIWFSPKDFLAFIFDLPYRKRGSATLRAPPCALLDLCARCFKGCQDPPPGYRKQQPSSGYNKHNTTRKGGNLTTTRNPMHARHAHSTPSDIDTSYPPLPTLYLPRNTHVTPSKTFHHIKLSRISFPWVTRPLLLCA